MDEAGEDGKLLASTLSFPEVQATQSTLGRGKRRRGASLSHEASCIFFYLSTKSHKRWPVSRLQTAPDMGNRSQEAPHSQQKENSIYLPHLILQTRYIYSSLTLKTLTVKKDCTVFTTTDPYSLETLENKCHSPTGQIL